VSAAVSLSWPTTLYATCATQATATVAFGFILPLVPLYLKQLHVETDRAIVLWSGALATSTAVALAVASPIWGAVADRRGRRLMVLRAMLIGGCVVGLMGLAQNVWQFLGLRILQGIFTGTVAASTALVATSVPRDRLASSMGLLQTSVFVGIAGGPVLGGVVAEVVGIRGTFIIAGLFLIAAGAGVWLLVHEHYDPLRDQHKVSFFQALYAGVTSRTLLPLLVVLFLVQMSTGIVFPILPLFVNHLAPPGAPVKLYAGLAFGVTAGFAALSALSYSRFAHRSGYRQVLILACFGAALLFAPQAFAKNIGQLLVLRSALGIFTGALIPTTNALIALVTPQSVRGSAYGISSSATALGMVAGPLLGSALGASLGLPSIFMATALVFALAGSWVALLVREPAAESEVQHLPA